MPGLTSLWSPAKARKVSFSARLSTKLPGIAFTARGSAWFRQDITLAPEHIPVMIDALSELPDAPEEAQ